MPPTTIQRGKTSARSLRNALGQGLAVTLAALPPAAQAKGILLYVDDADNGAGCVVVSNGTAYKKVALGATAIAGKATYTTALSGANNDVIYTAVAGGAAGANVTIRYLDPSGNNAALSVSVSTLAITVNLATGSGGAITSTAAQVRTAVAASGAAAALVTTALAASNSGAGVVTALAATNLVLPT